MFDTGENLADADSAVGNNNNGYHENEHRSCDEAATNPATPRSRRTQSCEFIHYEHQMRHHYGNSPGVDSLEVSALTPDLSSPAVGPGKVTSTPRSRTETSLSRCSSNVRCSSAPCDHSRTSSVELGTGEGLKMPIVGYEVMEQREKFTVFKIHVVKSQFESWFIFRRYTDFERLNDKLKILFPYFRLALPPKRWFSDNFDTDFLEDRMLGLQAFVDNITGHRDMLNSKTVIDFFCLEDPPGPHDSLEESRARCQDLEESVYSLRQELKERETTIELLRDQLAVQAAQIDHLNKSLRVERSVHSRVGTPVSVKNISLTEPDREMQVEGKREGGAGSNQS